MAQGYEDLQDDNKELTNPEYWKEVEIAQTSPRRICLLPSLAIPIPGIVLSRGGEGKLPLPLIRETKRNSSW